MEKGLGADLSRVRIHDGIQANTVAQQVGARAFTVGRDIFFGRNEYRPASRPGRYLLAHELAHAVHAARNSSEQGVVRRSLQFDTAASNLQIGLLGERGRLSRSSGMLPEFVSGLKTFFGITVDSHVSPDGSTTTLDTPTVDSGKGLEVSTRITTKLYDMVGEYVETKGPRSAGQERMFRYSMNGLHGRWHSIHRILVDRLKSDTPLRVLNDPKSFFQAHVDPVDNQIHINPTTYPKIVARADTGWDGFWILLHEILHTEGLGDATVGGIAGDYLKENVSIPIGDANGEDVDAGNPKLWTTPGDIEEWLNAVRMIFGLPLRYGYSDDSLIRFSKLSGERGKDFVYDVTGQTHGPKYFEYYGATMDDTLSNKLMTRAEGHDRISDTETEAGHARLRDGLIGRMFDGTLGGKPMKFAISEAGDMNSYVILDIKTTAMALTGEKHRYACVLEYDRETRSAHIYVFHTTGEAVPIGQLTRKPNYLNFAGDIDFIEARFGPGRNETATIRTAPRRRQR